MTTMQRKIEIQLEPVAIDLAATLKQVLDDHGTEGGLIFIGRLGYLVGSMYGRVFGGLDDEDLTGSGEGQFFRVIEDLTHGVADFSSAE